MTRRLPLTLGQKAVDAMLGGFTAQRYRYETARLRGELGR